MRSAWTHSSLFLKMEKIYTFKICRYMNGKKTCSWQYCVLHVVPMNCLDCSPLALQIQQISQQINFVLHSVAKCNFGLNLHIKNDQWSG